MDDLLTRVFDNLAGRVGGPLTFRLILQPIVENACSYGSSTVRIAVVPIGQSRVQFLFDDPKHIGDGLELDFENGAKVPATSLFASQKYLRRQMSEALDNRRTREYVHNP